MSVHDFRGSGNITAMACSVMGLSSSSSRQFSLSGPCRLDLVKTNLGPTPTPRHRTPDRPRRPRHTRLTAPPSFGGAADDKPDPETWLIDYLKPMPYLYRDILAEAESCRHQQNRPLPCPQKLGGRVIDSKGKHSPAATNGCWPNRPPDLEEPAEEEEDPANA